MAKHNRFGKQGEDAATAFLVKQGYQIRERNWRSGHLELDIVASKGDELVIVEVKTRSNNYAQDPLDAVDNKKIRHIVRAADTYIKLAALDMNVRFDIITLVGSPEEFQIEHIEDAFYSPLF